MNFPITHIEEVRAIRTDRTRVADLLGRYPQVSAREAREILTFMRTGRHLDIGLLTSNERLRPKLDAFMADHARHFRVKWVEATAVIAGIIAFLAILWLVWEALS